MNYTLPFLCAVLVATLAWGQTSDGELLLQEAKHKQLVSGDLDGAIRLYQKIISEHAANRPVAAKALVELGRCYERLGKNEAKKAYGQVIRDYADQREPATRARERLVALLRPTVSPSASVVTRRLWHGSDVDTLGAPSPDGTYLTFVDWESGDLAIRDMQEGASRRITKKGSWTGSMEFALFSIVSPDGKSIAYAWSRSDLDYDLRIARADGSGSPRSLTRRPYLQPMAWSPDGKQILALLWQSDGSQTLALVSAADGTIQAVDTFKEAVPQKASFSPDGYAVVYDLEDRELMESDLFLLPIGGTRAPLVRARGNDMMPLWTPDGSHVLFVSDRGGTFGLWSIEVANRAPKGEPKLVKTDIGRVRPLGMTKHGQYFYGVETGLLDVYEVPYDPAEGKLAGSPRRIADRYVGSNLSPDFSPVADDICYVSRQRGPTSAPHRATRLMIRSSNGNERELTPPLRAIAAPRWRPDGKAIFVMAEPHGSIYSIDASTGEATPVVIRPADSFIFNSGFTISPDGKVIYMVVQKTPEKTFLLVRHELEGGNEAVLYRSQIPPVIPSGIAVSRDGTLLVFRLHNPTGEPAARLMIIPTSGGEAREVFSIVKPEQLAAFHALQFTADGKHLLFAQRRSTESQATELWRVPIASGAPVNLGLAMDRIRDLRFSRDGKRLVFSAGAPASEVWVLEHFLPQKSQKISVRQSLRRE